MKATADNTFETLDEMIKALQDFRKFIEEHGFDMLVQKKEFFGATLTLPKISEGQSYTNLVTTGFGDRLFQMASAHALAEDLADDFGMMIASNAIEASIVGYIEMRKRQKDSVTSDLFAEGAQFPLPPDNTPQ